jgi:eukaryotic-like serine/threonine-protein kinase
VGTGDYPKGREKYPVAGVSWYEAAAYAEFAGKSLPTAYHWMRASQSAVYTPLITAGSNFRSEGTQPVGSESALSGFGTTDMAGNVKEWCLNEAQDAKRLILGGGFGEPNYMFHHMDAQFVVLFAFLGCFAAAFALLARAGAVVAASVAPPSRL